MKRGDFFILLACLIAAGALFVPRLLAPPAGTAIVTAEKIRHEFALKEDLTREIHGVVIEISGGRARVVSSPCRDQLCVKAGWISHSGEAAICLPQRVVLQVQGNGQGQSGRDGVAY